LREERAFGLGSAVGGVLGVDVLPRRAAALFGARRRGAGVAVLLGCARERSWASGRVRGRR